MMSTMIQDEANRPPQRSRHRALVKELRDYGDAISSFQVR